jgi:hypothetical protein
VAEDLVGDERDADGSDEGGNRSGRDLCRDREEGDRHDCGDGSATAESAADPQPEGDVGGQVERDPAREAERRNDCEFVAGVVQR